MVSVLQDDIDLLTDRSRMNLFPPNMWKYNVDFLCYKWVLIFFLLCLITRQISISFDNDSNLLILCRYIPVHCDCEWVICSLLAIHICTV